jgi:hypothetical protein
MPAQYAALALVSQTCTRKLSAPAPTASHVFLQALSAPGKISPRSSSPAGHWVNVIKKPTPSPQSVSQSVGQKPTLFNKKAYNDHAKQHRLYHDKHTPFQVHRRSHHLTTSARSSSTLPHSSEPCPFFLLFLQFALQVRLPLADSMAFAAGCTVGNVHFTSQRQHFLHRAFATMIIEGVYSRVPPGNSRGKFDFGQIDSFDSLIVWASCHKFWGCIGNIF